MESGFKRTHAWEMKRSYQRNMLISMLIVLGGVSGITVFISSGFDNRADLVVFTVRDARTVADVMRPQSHSSASGQSGAPHESDWLSGGVIPIGRLHISRDVGVSVDAPELAVSMPMPDVGQVEVTPLNSSDGDGTLWGLSDQEFFPQSHGRVQRVYPVERSRALRTSQPEYVVTDTGIFRIPEIIFPPEADARDTGVVEVEILIDHQGLIQWTFLSVYPPNKGFQRVVENAIKGGVYAAAEINGKKVARRIRTSILVIEGHDSEVMSEQGMDEYRVGFLPK